MKEDRFNLISGNGYFLLHAYWLIFKFVSFPLVLSTSIWFKLITVRLRRTKTAMLYFFIHSTLCTMDHDFFQDCAKCTVGPFSKTTFITNLRICGYVDFPPRLAHLLLSSFPFWSTLQCMDSYLIPHTLSPFSHHKVLFPRKRLSAQFGKVSGQRLTKLTQSEHWKEQAKTVSALDI